MDKAKVRRKITILWGTAQHPNTNPEETQACLAKVAELGTRYNLTNENESQAQATGVPGTEDTGVRWWETHIPDTGRRGASCAAALAYVIDACGGMSVRDKTKGAHGYRVTVVATEAAMELIRELVPVVLEQMHQRSVAECRRWRAEQFGGVGEGQVKKWREDYVRAFGLRSPDNAPPLNRRGLRARVRLRLERADWRREPADHRRERGRAGGRGGVGRRP